MTRYAVLVCCFFAMLVSPLYAQLPGGNDDGLPPPPVEGRKGYERVSNDDINDKIDRVIDVIDAGTPLMPAFMNLDTLKMLLAQNNICDGLLCFKSGEETFMNICSGLNPPQLMINPTGMKDYAEAVVIAGAPGSETQVFTVALIKLCRKGKITKDNAEAFNKKVITLLSALNTGFYNTDDIISVVSGKEGAYRETYCSELIWNDFSGNYSKIFGDDVEAWGLIIRSKVNFKGAATNKLSPEENALLETQLEAYDKHIAALDSMQDACYYYADSETLIDSIYYHYYAPTAENFKGLQNFEAFMAGKNLVSKSLKWKEYGNSIFASVGKTKGKSTIYTKAIGSYGVEYPTTAYLYTPLQSKGGKLKTKPAKAFCKEVLGYLNVSYNADSLNKLLDQKIRYYYLSGKDCFVSMYLHTSEDESSAWESYRPYENVDTLDKNSVSGPYFSIIVYPNSTLTIDSTTYNTIQDDTEALNNKKYEQCDSLYEMYRDSHRFVWQVLPPVVVKETYEVVPRLDLFDKTDTLTKRLKKIVNDTTTAANFFEMLYGYTWNLYEVGFMDTTLRSNLTLTLSANKAKFQEQSLSLILSDRTTTPAADSLYTLFEKQKGQILSLLNITIPKEIEDQAAKENTAAYVTGNYVVELKNNIMEGGIKYKLLYISPFNDTKITFVPHAKELVLQDTLVQIIPDTVLAKAIALSDTIFTTSVPDIFKNAAAVQAKLKDSGFNQYWHRDGIKYMHFTSKEVSDHYLIREGLDDNISLIIYTRGDEVLAVMLYYYGTPPEKGTLAYNQFTAQANLIFKALKVDVPYKLMMAMDQAQTYEGFMEDDLIGFFLYNYSYDSGSKDNLGIMAGVATKAFTEDVDK